MQPALTLFWMVTGLSLAVGTVMTIVGLVRAPEGHEDHEGFHYSSESGTSHDHAGDLAHPRHPELA